jgi:hypothetical protein
MTTHPRRIGAVLGALVGILVLVAGVVMGNLPLDRAGLEMNLVEFAGVGLIVAVVALLPGVMFGPWALGERRQMIWAGVLFALVVAAGTLFALVADQRRLGADPSVTASQVPRAALYLIVLGIAAAAAWVALLRAIAGGRRQGIPTLVVSGDLMATTILVESLTMPQ